MDGWMNEMSHIKQLLLFIKSDLPAKGLYGEDSNGRKWILWIEGMDR